MNRQEFHDLVASRGACADGRNWILNHRSNDAETIWLSINRLDWIAWLVCGAESRYEFQRLTIEQLRWHIVQTSLSALGAKFVQRHDLNRPLAKGRDRQAIATRARDLFWTEDAPNGWLCDTLSDALIWSSAQTIVPLRVHHSVEHLFIEDVRHVISFDEIVERLR